MWKNRSCTTKLSTSFKRLTGAANDGSASDNKKIPSTPLIINVRLNKKSIDAMVDTGSVNSIIHIHALRQLVPQAYIKYKKNVHRTANNTELRTIGLVKLKIQ